MHTPIASFIGRLAAFFAKVDVKVYTVHGFVLQPKVFYFVEKFMARTLTDYMFTVNQEDLDMAVREKFISVDRVLNINSVGIDTEHFDPKRISEDTKVQLRESLNIRKDVPIIGYVGRVVKSKVCWIWLMPLWEVRKLQTVSCCWLVPGILMNGRITSLLRIFDILFVRISWSMMYCCPATGRCC